MAAEAEALAARALSGLLARLVLKASRASLDRKASKASKGSKASKVLLAPMAPMDCKGSKASLGRPGPKALLVRKVPRGQKGRLVLRGLSGQKGLPALTDCPALLAQMELLARPAPKGRLVCPLTSSQSSTASRARKRNGSPA